MAAPRGDKPADEPTVPPTHETSETSGQAPPPPIRPPAPQSGRAPSQNPPPPIRPPSPHRTAAPPPDTRDADDDDADDDDADDDDEGTDDQADATPAPTTRAQNPYEPPVPTIATQRTPPGVRQDPITDTSGTAIVPPPPVDRDPNHNPAAGPEPDPSTLDDPYADMDEMGPPMRLVTLPVREDGTPNTLGVDIEIQEIVTDYRDVVKARVTGHPRDLSRLETRARNYFAQNWNSEVAATAAAERQATVLAQMEARAASR